MTRFGRIFLAWGFPAWPKIHVGVEPKIGGKPPKWMVKIMETPIKIDDLGGFPIIFGNTHVFSGKWMLPFIMRTYHISFAMDYGRKGSGEDFF